MPPNGTARRAWWVVSLVVVVLLCCRASKVYQSGPPHRKLRGQLETKPNYYAGSALEFIKRYGLEYRLFDMFFAGSNTVDYRRSVLRTEKEDTSFADTHKVKPHAAAKLYGVATAEAQPSLALLNYTYTHQASTEEMSLYNNKFRYGPNIDDRFMSIVFDRDPVEEAAKNDLAYVYFVGVNTELPQTYNYACKFPQHNAQSKVEIKRHLRNAVNKESQNSLIRCAVPWSVSSALSDNSLDVVLDLVRLPANDEEAALSLLRNVHVPRLDALDRRTFQFAAQTMIDDLENPLVIEWLVYNIMLGIEHFYFYYNAKSAEMDLEHSQLKPFLDANLVTIIYFPFLHTEHFMHVQHAALNAYLHQFGRYNEFVGFWDVDEFFMPANEHLPHLTNQPYNASILPEVVRPMIDDPNIPAMMFNTLDMDCAPHAAEHTTPKAHSAVTTHCTRTGFLFEEMHHSHGKMIVRPALSTYIMSPHRMNQPHVEWPDDGLKSGTFRHFNRFRYTREAIASGHFSEQRIGADDSLRNFTLNSLRYLVGAEGEEQHISAPVLSLALQNKVIK